MSKRIKSCWTEGTSSRLKTLAAISRRLVVAAINGETIEMFVRIAFMRALAGVAPGSKPLQPPCDASKDQASTFRNSKKRDPSIICSRVGHAWVNAEPCAA